MRLDTWGVLLLLVGCHHTDPFAPAATDKGTSTGAKQTMTLGASGGALTTADGRFTLTVPPGALTADTEIGIEPVTGTAPGHRGGAYRLTPDGQKFAQAVTLTFKYTPADLHGTTAEALRLGYQTSDGFWHMLESTKLDTAAGTVSDSQKHFTDVALLVAWQITPEEAVIATGQQLQLHLQYCEPEVTADPSGGDELSGLVPRCDVDDPELPHLISNPSWAVNGVPGGTIANGIVSTGSTAATYTAPPEEPGTDVVAVSCDFSIAKKGKGLAVSNVTVASPGWRGTVSWVLSGTANETVGMTMRKWDVTGSGMVVVVPGGQLGTATLMSASGTYTYSYDELYSNNYTAGGCTHAVVQHRVETLDGTSSDTVHTVFTGVDLGNGKATLALGVPNGPATGHIKVDATEAVTGATNCTSPADTHTDNPNTGSMPSDSLGFDVDVDAKGHMVGMKTVHIDGQPPHDYAVTYDLTSR